MTTPEQPLDQWPLKTRIILLDAWMRNPIEVTVKKHPNAENIIAEDDRGVVYYAHYKRIAGIVERKGKTSFEFDDLLDSAASEKVDYDALL